MRTTPVLIMVFAFATGALIFQIAGIGGMFGAADPSSDLQTPGEFEEEASDNPLNEEEDGERFDPDTRGEDNVVGFIISGFSLVFSYARLVVLFPIELQNIGVPRFAAYPVGLLMQAVLVFGIAQFASGRIWS